MLCVCHYALCNVGTIFLSTTHSAAAVDVTGKFITNFNYNDSKEDVDTVGPMPLLEQHNGGSFLYFTDIADINASKTFKINNIANRDTLALENICCASLPKDVLIFLASYKNKVPVGQNIKRGLVTYEVTTKITTKSVTVIYT